jgi:hypothetical protein
MAWSNFPAGLFTSGAILTAAQMNTYVRDNLKAIGDAWTAYTPTWTNLTVGNGTQASAYIAAGKLHVVRVEFVFGSTSSISGTPEFTLPNGVSVATDYDTQAPMGPAIILDSSAALGYSGFVNRSSNAARLGFQAHGVTGAWVYLSGLNATTPITFASGDKLQGLAVFEAA